MKLQYNPDKLSPKAEGPYTIDTVHANGTVTIRIDENTLERINLRRIRPYRRRFFIPMVFLLLNELCPLRGRMRYRSHYESRISLTYNHESIHDSLKIALESLIESYVIPQLFIQGSQFILT